MKKFYDGPVNLFYLFLLLFILIVPVDSGLLIRALAFLFVLLLWLVFLGATLSIRHGKTIDRTGETIGYYNPGAGLVVCLISFQYVAAAYVGYFYTGLNFFDALNNLVLGVSNYSVYQSYFNESGLAQFTLDKIPAILLFFYVKFIFVYIVFYFLVRQRKRPQAAVLIAAIPLIMISAFRGTNIEFFEVFIVVLCGIHIKGRMTQNYKLPILKVLLAGFILISIYSLQVNYRYGFEYTPSCNNEFCYDDDSVIYKLFPALYSLSAYFYFAPDYMARWFYILTDNISFIEFFLPGNGYLSGHTGKWLCGEYIKCGPTWAPDFELMIYTFGLFGSVFIVFVLSRLFKRLEYTSHFSFVSFLGYYLVSLQLIALPVGNFLLVSSANQIMLFAFIFLFLVKTWLSASKK